MRSEVARRTAGPLAIVTALVVGIGSAHGAPPPSPNEPSTEELAAAAEQKRMAVQQLLKIVRAEPTVKDVQRWALEFYKLEPERINAMARNARLKGLVPEIEGSVDNSVGHTYTNTKDGFFGPTSLLTIDPTNTGSFKERVSGANDQFNWRVRVAWNLDRLVFNSEALDAKSLNSLQENLVREVTALYFGRRRLLAGLLLTPPQEDEELFYELTRLDEMTATLDALTGDKFSKRAWRWDQQDDGEEEKAPPKEQGREAPAAKPEK